MSEKVIYVQNAEENRLLQTILLERGFYGNSGEHNIWEMEELIPEALEFQYVYIEGQYFGFSNYGGNKENAISLGAFLNDIETPVYSVLTSHLSDLQYHIEGVSEQPKNTLLNFLKFLILKFRDTNTEIYPNVEWRIFLQKFPQFDPSFQVFVFAVLVDTNLFTSHPFIAVRATDVQQATKEGFSFLETNYQLKPDYGIEVVLFPLLNSEEKEYFTMKFNRLVDQIAQLADLINPTDQEEQLYQRLQTILTARFNHSTL